jgi:hypothetical protein
VRKKAFCVGINDYPYSRNLNGCINDAKAWADLLIEHYDFPRSDVTIALDSEASRERILSGLQELLAGAGSGDVLVFTNSSHGTYVINYGPDDEYYNQALCPHDVRDSIIIDDELRDLFANIPTGVSLTVISDSCHSGDLTRDVNGRLVRFLDPSIRGDAVLEKPEQAPRKTYPESGMNEILLSGCASHEYAYDAAFNGTYHGAMSFYALIAIREANFRITFEDLHARVQRMLTDNAFDQHPQLEGKSTNKARQIFT